MDATLNGILLLALLVVPGFLHYLVARAIRPWEDDEPSETSLLFTSVGITGLIVSLEILGVGILAAVFDGVGDRAKDAFNGGLSGYGSAHPADVLVGLPAFFLFNAVVLGCLGTKDPLGKIEEMTLRPRSMRKENAWFLSFWPEEVVAARGSGSKGEQSNYVQVYMAGSASPRYRGAVGAFDITSDKHGDRYLQLWNAIRREGDEWQMTRLTESLSSVLLKCSDITAIEFTYDGVPDGMERVSS